MTYGTYVGRSCPTVPPLETVTYARPSEAALRAAVPPIADRALACFASKLQQAAAVRVVFFGSSVTAGIRCKHTKERSVNFPQQLVQLLEQRYPRTNLTVDVYGYPGASPSFMHACASTLMRTRSADLYILEMTDNLSDGYAGVGHAIESLMSTIRARSPQAALLLLAPIPQRCVRSLKRMKPFQHVPLDDGATLDLLHRTCYNNASVAASFEDVGAAHNLSTVSARQLVRAQMIAQPRAALRLIGKLHYDAVHPSGAGHWQLAIALDFAIQQQTWPALLAQQHEPACAPLSPGALEAGHVFESRERYQPRRKEMVCALGEDLQRHVLRAVGWRYATEYNAQGLPKPGYVAERPGAHLDLCYRPRLQSGGPGPDRRAKVQSAWSLGYLMSYEHMGMMRGECLRSEGSCSCGARIFNAHWRLPVSQPHISRLKLQIRVPPPLPPPAYLSLSISLCRLLQYTVRVG